MQTEELHDAIGSIYDAVLDEATWPFAVEQLCQLLGGASAALIVHDLGQGRPALFLDHNIDPADWDRYAAYYCSLDLWRDAAVRLPSGQVVHSDQIVDCHTFRTSEWLNDFLAPIGIGQSTLGLFQRRTGILSAFSVFQPLDKEPISPERVRMFQILLPHLDRAVQQRERLRDAACLRDAGFTALDNLTHGLLLVEPGGTVIWANRAASDLLRQGDGVSVQAGQIALARQADSAHFRCLLASAAQSAMSESYSSGGSMAVARPSGKSPYMALVTRLGGNNWHEWPDLRLAGPVIAVFISDPEKTPELPVERLQRLYGLTRAEAKLIAALASGIPLSDYADQICRSKETVRAHLKSAMAKTDTRSQSALMRLVMSAAAALSKGKT